MTRKSSVFLALWAFTLGAAPALPAHAEWGLFGSSETASDNLTPFSKWMGMLNKAPRHTDAMQQSCKKNSQCPYNAWMNIVKEARGLAFEKMLTTVHREINHSPYVLDIVNWGVEDYWETPYEFFVKEGDCEDYAIAKYMTLKLLGVSPDSMRIVVLQDHNLKLLHSVLAVQKDGKTYILDNQIQQVVLDASIHHYQPIYSINERHWWRHLPN